MLDEPFASGDSVIHRLDPRFRVVAIIVYSFIVAVVYRFPALWLALAASLVMIHLARLAPKRIFSRLLLVNGFVAMFWVILPFTAQGEILYQLGPLGIHRPGIILAAQITLKSNTILIALIALMSTMSFATLGHAMNQLKFPEKLVHLLLLTYRYIFVIEQEYKRIMRAIKTRGFSPDTSLHCYKTYAYVIGMLLVRASARAERVYQAMRCRGFTGRFYSLTEFDASRKNYVFTILITLVIAGIVFLEYFP